MPDHDLFHNDKFNVSNLMYDLDSNKNMMEKISRIGQSSQTRSRPLRVQKDEGCASLFLDAAHKLKFTS